MSLSFDAMQVYLQARHEAFPRPDWVGDTRETTCVELLLTVD